MRKPDKPTNTLPESFGGFKENFSSDKVTYGYQPDIPDILGGANLNYLLDTCGDNNRYFKAICDFIRDIPVAKTITVNTNGELIYQDWLGGRNFGELVYSSIPLSDSSLKLLDGSLIQGTGIYSNFVEYMAGIVNTYPTIFTTEENWQETVGRYGVCGKYVYNATNNTIRIPKVTGIIEGTADVNALGNIVAAGLPTLTTATSGNHTHSGTTGKGSAHSHTRGTMNITGTFGTGAITPSLYKADTSGAFYNSGSDGNFYASTPTKEDRTSKITFNASRNWTGSTSSESSHTHSYSISSSGSHNHTINWGTTTNTVQPQTVKMFVYVVVATDIVKSDSAIDLDNIISDLNGKADINGSNMVNSLSTGAKEYFSRLSLPSNVNININIPTSGDTITIPADGYICCSNDITLTNETRRLQGNNMPVIKNDIVLVEYNTTGEDSEIFFVYAQGGI